MGKLKSGSYILPFWGKKGFIKGRDPLGMQIASLTTYSILLPGLTSLTRRIRYYSFYCWLLEQYAQVEGHTDPAVFRRFIRRAELIFSFGMTICFPDSPAVVGNLWAEADLKKNRDYTEDFIVDIARGADIGSDRTYWKNFLGAFGQYYLGSLVSLDLIEERRGNSGVYICTKKGEQLSAAFSQAIDNTEKQIFLKAVKNGKITIAELRSAVTPISLDAIIPLSEEWSLLKNILLAPDHPSNSTSFRRSTISDFITFIKKGKAEEVDLFSEEVYETVLKKGFESATPCEKGWFIYQLNEFILNDPNNKEALLLKASILEKTGNSENAIEAYSTLINVYPDLIDARKKRTSLYLTNQLYAQALSDLDFIVQNEPDNIKAKIDRINCRLSLKQFGPAEKELQSLGETGHQPEFPSLYSTLGSVRLELNQNKNALQAFQEHLK
ncbi:hypothetical protein EBR03_06940, partial [bacterium]|nr:hypothetical protein [bacterium]